MMICKPDEPQFILVVVTSVAVINIVIILLICTENLFEYSMFCQLVMEINWSLISECRLHHCTDLRPHGQAGAVGKLPRSDHRMAGSRSVR